MDIEVIVAVVLNVVLLVSIVFLIYGSYKFRSELMKCSSKESDYCYTVHCPVDNPSSAPCFGFAMRKGLKGEFYCSNNSSEAVDASGKPIKDN